MTLQGSLKIGMGIYQQESFPVGGPSSEESTFSHGGMEERGAPGKTPWFSRDVVQD